ncbi:MAG: hypothetical protein E8A46_11425 [Bradyrhizobium sp.]|uniref:hypothetical protein n=1 Tax=Bradyrhizobium sp. TaxID=376 RepID=UPI00121401A1|nr:hypothetical protein [Bradyrhizobium sp.]THD53287.1 MAG: hypothetical protein E8A46_11425 [Bradyrhizobium sp.]
MINSKDAVVWINRSTREVRVLAKGQNRSETPSTEWGDPIGAAYSEWQDASDHERILLMLETAIDLAMQGFDLGNVLRAFAEVKEFRALGSASFPMCRALTSALVGRCLEPNTMSFEELLERYRPGRG